MGIKLPHLSTSTALCVNLDWSTYTIFFTYTCLCFSPVINSGRGCILVISGLGQALADSRGSHQGLLKTELIHARALLEGSDPQSSCGSKGGGWGVTPYSARSSLHSTSGPALMGLVHFCCMGSSSSATQHTSPVPVGDRKFENAQFQAERPRPWQGRQGHLQP